MKDIVCSLWERCSLSLYTVEQGLHGFICTEISGRKIMFYCVSLELHWIYFWELDMCA